MKKLTPKKNAVQKTRSSIADAVKHQMIADAPVGVFLSGGIDSGIIAQLADNEKNQNLNTLSIWFSEKQYSEKQYQDLFVQKLNSTHHAILLEEKDFHDQFPQFLRSMDMPSCDGINTWFISKFAAAEGIKAVLSGIGADELFGGYPSFKRINAALALQHLPDAILSVAGRSALKKLSRISYLKMKGIRGAYLFLRGHFTPAEIAAQTGAYEKEVWQILNEMPVSPDLAPLGKKNRASWMEFNLYMQDQLLRDADVMSMAHGLEIRVPFLDNEVIQTAFSIDQKIKYNPALQKGLLIHAFNDKLPEPVWKRKKMGFSFPFAQWLKNSPYVKELSAGSNAHTRKVCAEFYAGRLHWSRVMSLVVLGNVDIRC